MKMSVCVIGLGEIGLPMATYITKQGFETWGYDLSDSQVDRAKENKIKSTTDWQQIPHRTIVAYVICVTTSLDNLSKPNVSAVFEVCEKIAKTGSNSLVSIESTLALGTCRNIYKNIFHESCILVHVPHRYWKEDPVTRGVNQLRIIGGVDGASLDKGKSFYKGLSIPLHPVSSIEIAEMSKIVENSHRFLQIAFAEELKMVCDEKGINMNELREAVNTKWNVDIPEPRTGIGGHCLPKDIRYLLDISENQVIPKSAIEVDFQYRKHLVQRPELPKLG